MTQNSTVVVIGGGTGPEHDVSNSSASSIAQALREGGFAVEVLTIARDGVWHDADGPLGDSRIASVEAALRIFARNDVVFPAVHGDLGEDGTLAALCTLAGVRMVGSSMRAGAIGMDKHMTKLLVQSLGFRTARGRVVAASGIDDVAFEGEVVVKPASAGSSYGVSLATDADQLRAALRTAAQYDDSILVEEVIRGREIDVAVLREADGSRWAAPALEIHAEGLFDTETKYGGSARFTVPAELTDDERAALEQAALGVFDALGCTGVARVDFFLTEDGPILNEINTLPGMSAASQAPRMFAAAGVDYPELVRRLVAAA